MNLLKMLGKFRLNFSSFEMFVSLQFDLRRHMLEYYNKLFRKRIIRQIHLSLKNSITNKEFTDRISSIVNIPSDIKLDHKSRRKIIRSADKTINGIYNLAWFG